jgi:hypothetical protein
VRCRTGEGRVDNSGLKPVASQLQANSKPVARKRGSMQAGRGKAGIATKQVGSKGPITHCHSLEIQYTKKEEDLLAAGQEIESPMSASDIP